MNCVVCLLPTQPLMPAGCCGQVACGPCLVQWFETVGGPQCMVCRKLYPALLFGSFGGLMRDAVLFMVMVAVLGVAPFIEHSLPVFVAYSLVHYVSRQTLDVSLAVPISFAVMSRNLWFLYIGSVVCLTTECCACFRRLPWVIDASDTFLVLMSGHLMVVLAMVVLFVSSQWPLNPAASNVTVSLRMFSVFGSELLLVHKIFPRHWHFIVLFVCVATMFPVIDFLVTFGS
jgi:hypothetical protein